MAIIIICSGESLSFHLSWRETLKWHHTPLGIHMGSEISNVRQVSRKKGDYKPEYSLGFSQACVWTCACSTNSTQGRQMRLLELPTVQEQAPRGSHIQVRTERGKKTLLYQDLERFLES